MKYYIYRLKYKHYISLRQTDIIKNSLDNLELEDKDKAVIIVSKSMNVIGIYRYSKEQNIFIREKQINKVISKFYEKLPMVEFVNENTYKMFSKRLREIDQENYEIFAG